MFTNRIYVVYMYKQDLASNNQQWLMCHKMLPKVMFSNGPLYMDVPVLAKQQELIYVSSVQTQDAIWKICREWWLIGIDGEREREHQGNPCYQSDLMMMMMMIISLNLPFFKFWTNLFSDLLDPCFIEMWWKAIEIKKMKENLGWN